MRFLLTAGFFCALLAGAAGLSGCGFSSTDEQLLGVTPVIVEDIYGNRWDFTYAVVHYEWDVVRLSSSAGPDARPEMIEPEMLAPGDFGYPGAFTTVRIIGAEVDGDSRAYPLPEISRNEVVDDNFGDVAIAVAY